MLKYFYLDLSLNLQPEVESEITAILFKKNIIDAVTQLFGEVAACVDIDILKYNPRTKRAILRVPENYYVKKLGPGGKDIVIFATAEDHKIPSSVTLPEADPQPGLILPNGDINWNCPCLGGMATGPCGVEFRNAFSCFHYSEAEPKGSDCYELFKTMQNCMQKYPTLYNKDLADDDDFSSIDTDQKDASKTPIQATEKDK